MEKIPWQWRFFLGSLHSPAWQRLFRSLLWTTLLLSHVPARPRPVEGFTPLAVPSTRRLQKVDASNVRTASGTIRKPPAPTGTRLHFHFDSSYSYCLEHYYFPTQVATGAICATFGDVIAQLTEKDEKSDLSEDSIVMASYDPLRTFHYFLKGIGGGIVWAYWFDTSDPLSNSLTHSVLGSLTSAPEEPGAFDPTWASAAVAERATRTIISILLEQFLVSPLLFACWDIPLPALLRGTPVRQIPTQVQAKLVPLLVANAKVWTVVNVITYNIPVEYRVLFASCADILWQSINSGITSQEVPASPTTQPLPPFLAGIDELSVRFTNTTFLSAPLTNE